MSEATPLMYGELASWFHLLTPPKDYVETAASHRELFETLSSKPVRTVLELGAGGGNNASHLKAWYQMTLTDRSPEMIATSCGLNPECEHVEGDMRSLRLGRTFDAVLIDDAISYMTTEQDVLAALTTARAHLEPGGVVVFAPDETAEEYVPATEHGGEDGEDRAMRYFSWDDVPVGTTVRTIYVYVLRDANGVRVEHEIHTFGLFPLATWETLIRRAGFEPHRRSVEHWQHPQTKQYIFAGVAKSGTKKVRARDPRIAI